MQPQQARYWRNHQRAANPEPFDPDVRTICELYQQAPHLHEPGVHLVSTAEKTGIPANERAPPTRPLQAGLGERVEFDYIRHGTQTLIANFEVATGQVMAPAVGPSRPEEDVVSHLERTSACDPAAAWIFSVDRLHTHQAESLVCIVAQQCGLDAELGVQGKSGVLASMPARAAFWPDPTHRLRFVYTPKQTSWLNQVESWCGILVRRLLKRGSCTAVTELRQRIVAFIEYFNKTMAKPVKWTYAGRPLVA